MIYTIGQASSYRKAIAKKTAVGERLLKVGRCEMDGWPNGYPGGSVWECAWKADVVARQNIGFAVFGVEADWNTQTTPSENGYFHDLLVDAPIVDLGDDIDFDAHHGVSGETV